MTKPTEAKSTLLSTLRSGDADSFSVGAAQLLRKGERWVGLGRVGGCSWGLSGVRG